METQRHKPEPAASSAESDTCGEGRKPAPHRPILAEAGINRHSTVESEVRALEQAGVMALRAEWRRLFGGEPPRVSRDLLVRALAYRVQERAFGGLSRASLKRLRELADDPEGRAPPPDQAASLRPGAKLVREWHGSTHIVLVTDTGFDYHGPLPSSYRSSPTLRMTLRASVAPRE